MNPHDRFFNIDRVTRDGLSQRSIFRVGRAVDAWNLRPTPTVTVVTVAGTNGKGTACFCLEALALSCNKRVGLFTSPHVLSINERIRINGKAITLETFQEMEDQFLSASKDEGGLTFFERTFLIALALFKKENLDLWIIEVGLGGRFCATNAISCNLAILTGIDFDHTEILGHSLEAIGQEKAGIFRENTPIVLAMPSPPQSVLERAQLLQAPLIQIGKDWQMEQSQVFDTCFQTLYHRHLFFSALMLPAASIGAAIVAWECLFGKISRDILQPLIEKFKLIGRFQTLRNEPLSLVDVAHNPQSLRRLKQLLEFTGSRRSICRWNIVFSMLRRKALTESLLPFRKDNRFVWYLPRWNDPDQFFSSGEILSALQPSTAYTFSTMEQALANASLAAGQQTNQGVIVTGSFLTVAAALRYFSK